jgi:hypothetical protein
MTPVQRVARIVRGVVALALAGAVSSCVAPVSLDTSASPMPTFAPGTWQSNFWGASVTLRSDGTGSAIHMPVWRDGVRECYPDKADFEDYTFTWEIGTFGDTIEFNPDGTRVHKQFLPFGSYDYDWSAIIYYACIPDGPGDVVLDRAN